MCKWKREKEKDREQAPLTKYNHAQLLYNDNTSLLTSDLKESNREQGEEMFNVCGQTSYI